MRKAMCSALIGGVLVWAIGADSASAQLSKIDPFCRRPVSHNYEKSNGPHLAVKAKVFNPGYVALFRVENSGVSPVGLIGEEFAFEQHGRTGWILDPASPMAFTRQRLGAVPAGESGFCRSFLIPTNVAPGHYRFSKSVRVGSKGRIVQLTSAFDVHPTS